MTLFRCSTASRDLEEPLAGSASTVRTFLLLEAAGPWGVDAVRDCRLDEEVRQRLLGLESTHRIRPLLVRRHGRSVAGPRRVFLARADRTDPWAETAALDDVRELLDVDLTAVAEGRSAGLTPHRDPLFLVCTHGRHDACCAERGRPLAAGMAEVAPEETWEVSHIGGDRFAANLLVLPHGLYYGRVAPGDASGLVATHRAGRLDLTHLRGRSSYPFAVQAAEVHLRRQTGEDGLMALRLERARREGTVTRAVFAGAAGCWEVTVRTERGEPRLLTCRAPSPSPGLVHTVERVERLP